MNQEKGDGKDDKITERKTMKIKLIKEELESIDLDKNYSVGQYKKVLEEINKIVNSPDITNNEIKEEAFIFNESELSKQELNGAIELGN